jgi:hypothetical protein
VVAVGIEVVFGLWLCLEIADSGVMGLCVVSVVETDACDI